MKKYILLIICIFYEIILSATPTITSLTPYFGNIGISVTINGTGFSPIASENSVQFGAVKAQVISSTVTSLNIIVPAGAGSIVPVSVTVNGKVCFSTNSSTPIFQYMSNTKYNLAYGLQTMKLGKTPENIGIGDFNDDGKSDFVLLKDDSTLTVYFQSKNNTYSDTLSFKLKENPKEIIVNDLNGDNVLDILLSNNSSNTLGILLGNGDGTFKPVLDLNINIQPSVIDINDINNDGNVDIIVANSLDSNTTILYGNGDGSFNQNTIKLESTFIPNLLLIADFNGDGLIDIVVANKKESFLNVFYGNGINTFDVAKNFYIGWNIYDMSVIYFNNDKCADIAMVNSDNHAHVIIGNILGNLSEYNSYSLGYNALNLSVGDFNGDGYEDIVTANNSKNTITILYGAMYGQFNFSPAFLIGTNSFNIRVCDLNNDGKADIITSNPGDSTISILYNGTPFSPIALPATIIDSTSFKASWNPVSQVSNYYLDVATDSSFTSMINGYTNIKVVNNNEYNVTGLIFGKEYFYRIRSSNDNGSSTNSNIIKLQLFTKQQIIFNSIKLKFLKDSVFTVSATGGGSGNPVTFISSDSNIAKCTGINGSIIILTGTGICRIYANQIGNNIYYKAHQEEQILRVVDPVKIDSIFPISGDTGTLVTIYGKKFSTILNQNKVLFGSTQAEIISATSSSLIVKVPVGIGSVVSLSVMVKSMQAYSEISKTPYFTITNKINSDLYYKQKNIKNCLTGYILPVDINKDGNTEILIPCARSITILLNDGKGTFDSSLYCYTGIISDYVSIGDLNYDGNIDLIASNKNEDLVSILLGNGDGTFLSYSTYYAGINCLSTKVSDFNNDGKPDIAICGKDSMVSILFGIGKGQFSSPYYLSTQKNPNTLLINDINNDGENDIIVSNSSNKYLDIFLGNGDGSFINTTYSINSISRSIAIFDVNNDQKLDIIAVLASDSICVFLGKSNVTFVPTKQSTLGINPFMISLADFNGDGIIDIASANSGYIWISLGKGDGSFNLKSKLNGGSYYNYLSVADLTNDGRADLISSCSYDQFITVYLNSVPIVPKALNATLITKTNFIANWEASISAKGYIIDVATDSLFVSKINRYFNKNVGNVLSCKIDSIKAGIIYYYRIRAYNGNGTSANSNIKHTPPLISYFSPIKGKVGSQVTIYGTGFSSIIDSNNVRFGAVKAHIISANDTSLTVSVPFQAGSIVPISLNVDGYITQSEQSITPFYTVQGIKTDFLEFVPISIQYANWDPNGVLVADFNNDGYVDVLGSNKGELVLYSGTKNGLSDSVKWAGTGYMSGGLKKGDFNGDGFIDFLGISNGGIVFYINNGSGFFYDYSGASMPDCRTSFDVCDFNKDGVLDILTIETRMHTLTVYLGNGDATFNRRELFDNYTLGKITVADFNNDGNPDLASINYSDKSLDFFWGRGDGSLDTNVSILNVNNDFSCFTYGDFNNDNKIDIAVSNQYLNSVSIFLGNGNGSFIYTNNDIPIGDRAISIVVADFNGDENADLATANSYDNTIDFLIGDGYGNFKNMIQDTVDYGPHDIAIGDFNGDGNADIVSANYDSYSFLLNKQNTAPIAINATNVNTTNFTANWLKLSCANGYYIDVATDSNFTKILPNYNNLYVFDTLMFTINGLNINTKYYYRIRGKNSNVLSDNSNIIVVSTQKLILSIIANDSTFSVDIVTNGNWTVSSDVPWITYSPNSGIGNAKISLIVEPNSSTLSRIGTISIISDDTISLKSAKIQTITVKQAGIVTIINNNNNNTYIHPNPANSFFKIKSQGSVELKVYSVTGELVINKKVENNETVLTNNLSLGIYIVKILNNNSINTEKLIINK
jgi:hypothetical protein